jgi:rhamnose utilization protein RhaD (predicted bifunctional aldolase and dehydrogenase)
MAADRFVDNLRDNAKASTLDRLGRLIYRSNPLGSDRRVTRPSPRSRGKHP